MEKLENGKENCRDDTNIDNTLILLNKFNTEISLLVTNVSQKMSKIDDQVQKNVKHIEGIESNVNTANSKCEMDLLANNEENEKIEMCHIKNKLRIIDEKIESYNQEIKSIEAKLHKKAAKNMKRVSKNKMELHACEFCNETFGSNYNLEIHITTHQEAIAVKCDSCEKSFYSKWRLQVYERGHQKVKKRRCHYYNNQLECPFEMIGCKFDHRLSTECKFGSKCQTNKCQFRHD